MSDHDLVGEMVAYYAKRAPLYDESMGYTSPDFIEAYSHLVCLLRQQLSDHDVLEIACGPGHWTWLLSADVRSIVATDVNEVALHEARKKTYPNGKVKLRIADAYTLEGIKGPFTAAFAIDWWSHIPRSRIPDFLRVLHDKLAIGARVIFVDQLPYEDGYLRGASSYDHEGNLTQERNLPDGQCFHIIKNYPSEEELRSYLAGKSVDFEYSKFYPLNGIPKPRWVISYTLK